MYKWHVHSAIGRGRPASYDLSRVGDGIAASLRQFSISASKNDDGGSRLPSRTQRSADAFKEVSKLAPRPSRGIDARSLAAKPPPKFTITRHMVDSPAPRAGGFVSRGGPQGGPLGGRGNFNGRGGRPTERGRGGRGRGVRGRGRGGKKGPRTRQDTGEDVLTVDPWTAEEAEELIDIQGGYPAPWRPTTSMESLAAYMPPVSTGSSGLINSAVYKMAVATDNINPDFKTSYDHLRRARNGGTLFETIEQKTDLEKFSGPLRKEVADQVGYFPTKFGSLSPSDRDALNRQWIAGQYVKPKPAKAGDVLGQVAAYTYRNETYLAEDGKNLEEQLRSRLPAPTPKSQAKPQKVVK